MENMSYFNNTDCTRTFICLKVEMESVDESKVEDGNTDGLSSDSESFTLLSNSMLNNSEQHENEQRSQPDETVLPAEIVEKKAHNIVNKVIDSASMSLRSSGDFSILSDSEQFNDNEEISKEDLEINKLTDNEEHGKWMDVLGNELLRKKVVSAGEGKDTRPQRGQEVTVLLETKLEDGNTVEDPHKLMFILADREVIDALDLTVNLMEKGEKSIVISDPKYCYGTEGKPPNIPPDAKLTFHIELLDIQEGPYNASVAISKRLSWVDRKRQYGNELYMKGNWQDASFVYVKCTRVLQQALNQQHEIEVETEIKSYSVKSHNNLAAAYMKLDQWKDALQACLSAERFDPKNVKTLFRKGKILSKLGQTKKSIAALKKASQLDPDDKTVQNELAKQQKQLADQTEAEKKMYQRMMGGSPVKSDKPDNDGDKSSVKNMIVGGSLFAIGAAVLIGVYLFHR